jgi:hypothetical protein
VPVTRVLFVGNSYTSYNDGLDKQLERLAPSIVTERVTYGGFTLENHWTDGTRCRPFTEADGPTSSCRTRA